MNSDASRKSANSTSRSTGVRPPSPSRAASRSRGVDRLGGRPDRHRGSSPPASVARMRIGLPAGDAVPSTDGEHPAAPTAEARPAISVRRASAATRSSPMALAGRADVLDRARHRRCCSPTLRTRCCQAEPGGAAADAMGRPGSPLGVGAVARPADRGRLPGSAYARRGPPTPWSTSSVARRARCRARPSQVDGEDLRSPRRR